MQNLIYLVIMALAGAAGWYAGSWKGRDAVEAVARYQKLGEDAEAALKQAKGQLQTDLAAKDAKFDADLKKLKDEATITYVMFQEKQEKGKDEKKPEEKGTKNS